MAQTTPNLGLKVWNLGTDTYNYEELANNFVSIDLHDHSPGNGMPVDGSSIKSGSIGPSQLGANSVSAGNIVDGSIGNPELGSNVVTYDKISTTPGTRIQNGNIDDAAITSGKLTPGIYASPVTSLTNISSLSDGYLVDYKFTLDNVNHVWRLRYNGSSWDFLGGTPIYGTTSNLFSTTSSAFDGNQTDDILSKTVPLYGKYLIQYSVTAYYATNETVGGERYGFATRLYNGSSGATTSTARASMVQQTASGGGTGTGSEGATVCNIHFIDIGSTNGKNIKNQIVRTEGPTTLYVAAGDQKMTITPINISAIQS